MTTTSSAISASSPIRWLESSTVAPSAALSAQERAHPADPARVEAVDRLVQDQHLRVAEQRRGQPEPAAHAQREAAGPLARRRRSGRRRRGPRRPGSRGRPLLAATQRRWARAVRARCAPLPSSSAPTVVRGRTSSRYGPAARPARCRCCGRSRPSRMRSVEVLPAPFGPRKPVTRPGRAAKLTSSRIWVRPLRLADAIDGDHTDQSSRGRGPRRIGPVSDHGRRLGPWAVRPWSENYSRCGERPARPSGAPGSCRSPPWPVVLVAAMCTVGVRGRAGDRAAVADRRRRRRGRGVGGAAAPADRTAYEARLTALGGVRGGAGGAAADRPRPARHRLARPGPDHRARGRHPAPAEAGRGAGRRSPTSRTRAGTRPRSCAACSTVLREPSGDGRPARRWTASTICRASCGARRSPGSGPELTAEPLGPVSQGVQVAVCRTVREALQQCGAARRADATYGCACYRDGKDVVVTVADTGPVGRMAGLARRRTRAGRACANGSAASAAP